jgi:predicted DNA-binding transcriptional regulator YafY
MMDSLALLEQAIQMKRTISFNYIKDGKRHGVRIGNPHALYAAKSGQVMCDIYQTSGDTEDYTLPDWRAFTIDEIDYVQILGAAFQPAAGYNREAGKYENVIAKV